MNKLIAVGSCVALGVTLRGQALPLSDWYGGDPNGVNGLSSERNTLVAESIVLDDFDHNGGTIAGVYGRFLSDIAKPAGFDYEIRTGVKQFNGGTLVSSGWGLLGSWKPDGYDFFGFKGYLAIIPLNLLLQPGHYWLGISVVGRGKGSAFLQTTDINQKGVGGELGDDNSFVTSSFFGHPYDPASYYVGFPADFSLGEVHAVPEPASMLALAGALGALAGRRRRAARAGL